MPLTDSKLRAIKPTGKVQKISDGGGLYIHVTDKGSMLWRMAYRYGGKQKTLSLGAYPTITLSQARLLREQAKQALASGKDPGAAKKEQKEKLIAEARKMPGPLSGMSRSSGTASRKASGSRSAQRSSCGGSRSTSSRK